MKHLISTLFLLVFLAGCNMQTKQTPPSSNIGADTIQKVDISTEPINDKDLLSGIDEAGDEMLLNDTVPTDVNNTPPDETDAPPAQETNTPSDQDTDNTPSEIDVSAIHIDARGSEPFWHFAASGSTLVMSEPSGTTTYNNITMTANGDDVTLTDGAGLTVSLIAQPCSDVAELNYSHKASVTRGNLTVNGCANILE